MDSLNLKIEDQKKYAESIISKCEKALSWEKSQIRKAAILTTIAELEYVNATSLEGEFENINIEFENNRKRVELYKKALDIFENITPKDIKDFNENKPIPSQPDYLGAKEYFKIFKQFI